jgi:hypothetical protein
MNVIGGGALVVVGARENRTHGEGEHEDNCFASATEFLWAQAGFKPSKPGKFQPLGIRIAQQVVSAVPLSSVAKTAAQTLYIEPGSPLENGYWESLIQKCATNL